MTAKENRKWCDGEKNEQKIRERFEKGAA